MEVGLVCVVCKECTFSRFDDNTAREILSPFKRRGNSKTDIALEGWKQRKLSCYNARNTECGEGGNRSLKERKIQMT